jgi:hypothetical protein
VMESGELIEANSPTKLLADTTSQLYKMASELGEAELVRLQQLAAAH